MSEMKTNIEFRSDIGVKLVQSVGSDASVIAAARVSVEGPESVRHLGIDPGEKSGLIRYLMKQRHGSPFEHASMTFLVDAPLFVFREWHRHRVGWSYSETSARYRQMEPVFWLPPEDRPLRPAPGYRSARPQFVAGTEEDQWKVRSRLKSVALSAWLSYREMVEAGFALEVARAVLPVSLYTSMYATCNPRSLMHFLSLRTHDESARHVSYPQAEIEQAARQMERAFAELFPLTHGAFCEFGRVAP